MKIRANLDHVVVAVRNLKVAVTYYEALGFKVEFGGYNGPTQNALIVFQDGSYIELISCRSEVFRLATLILSRLGVLWALERIKPSLSLRFLYWLDSNEGFKDWCIRSTDLAKNTISLTSSGIPMTQVEEFTRNKPDGKVARWMLAAPLNRALPFLIDDITPVNVRVPTSGPNSHPNGVVGISKLRLQTDANRQGGENEVRLLLERVSESRSRERSHVDRSVEIEWDNNAENYLILVTNTGTT